MSHRRAIARGGAAVWTPPQSANLVAAWVQGLSGNVAKLGTWVSQYGVSYPGTLYATEYVDASGLTSDAVDGSSSYVAGANVTPVGAVSVAGWLKSEWCYGLCVLRIASRLTLYAEVAGNKVRARFNGETSSTETAHSFWVVAYRHYAATHRADGSAAVWIDGVRSEFAGPYTINNTAGSINAGYRGDFAKRIACADCLYAWNGYALSDDDVADLYANDPYRRGNL